MHDPREQHFLALKRILRYLQGRLDAGLHIYSSPSAHLTLIQMQIGGDVLLLGDPLRVTVSSEETILSHGPPNDGTPSPVLALKQNTEEWRML